MPSSDHELGALLQGLREAEKLTQKQVADSLGVHQSSVSRLEQGDGTASPEDYQRYLSAIGSGDATRLAEILRVQWEHLAPPLLRHPEIRTLVEIEGGLARLDAFRQQG